MCACVCMCVHVCESRVCAHVYVCVCMCVRVECVYVCAHVSSGCVRIMCRTSSI